MGQFVPVVSALAVLCAASSALASDLDVSWTAPRDCPDRESLREGLSRRVGREVGFGADAALGVSGTIVAQGSGYELDLETRSAEGSERRTLQARSCSELARASLLIAALLLTEAPDRPAASDADSGGRGWFLFARARAVGDLGSLAAASLGPGIGVGIGFGATQLELGGIWLPSQNLAAAVDGQAPGSLQLTAASASACYEFFRGPTFGPCVQLELGRLSGRGLNLATTTAVSTTWLVGSVGARVGVRLFESLYGYADLRAGMPWMRPRFGVHGLGAVHEVPALIGRLEVSLEGRL